MWIARREEKDLLFYVSIHRSTLKTLTHTRTHSVDFGSLLPNLKILWARVICFLQSRVPACLVARSGELSHRPFSRSFKGALCTAFVSTSALCSLEKWSFPSFHVTHDVGLVMLSFSQWTFWLKRTLCNFFSIVVVVSHTDALFSTTIRW